MNMQLAPFCTYSVHKSTTESDYFYGFSTHDTLSQRVNELGPHVYMYVYLRTDSACVDYFLVSFFLCLFGSAIIVARANCAE